MPLLIWGSFARLTPAALGGDLCAVELQVGVGGADKASAELAVHKVLVRELFVQR